MPNEPEKTVPIPTGALMVGITEQLNDLLDRLLAGKSSYFTITGNGKPMFSFEAAVNEEVEWKQRIPAMLRASKAHPTEATVIRLMGVAYKPGTEALIESLIEAKLGNDIRWVETIDGKKVMVNALGSKYNVSFHNLCDPEIGE